MTQPTIIVDETHPCVSTRRLEALWFQVGGTVCNLRCTHCFISCAPDNDKFGFMDLETCRQYLGDAARMGTREFYFTGGEPFANPQMCDILEAALAVAPSTVLTNAMLFTAAKLKRLAEMRRNAAHPLEFRVSLDGYTASMNDAIRGAGVFEKTLAGTVALVGIGYRPIITVTRTWEGCDDEVLAGFRDTLQSRGYEEPRLKILPTLHLGAEAERTCGYRDCERVTSEMMEGYDQTRLVCSNSRLVTDRGVWVCPILLDEPTAKVSDTLTDSLGDYPLRHGACYTCWKHGAICRNECGDTNTCGQ